MNQVLLLQLLKDISEGITDPNEALAQLKKLPFSDLGFARIDHHRNIRQHIPEAIYGPNKTPQQCSLIVSELLSEPNGGPILLTRANFEQMQLCVSKNPGATISCSKENELYTLYWRQGVPRKEKVLILTAGTADLPVAEEAKATLESYGFRPQLLADCGVAGIHRLLASVTQLLEADAIIVVAGMEGALASVVGGITPAPVIAVPTSVGYGAALEGVTALLGMLSSCAAGLSVVGIDNGFGAATAIARIILSK